MTAYRQILVENRIRVRVQMFEHLSHFVYRISLRSILMPTFDCDTKIEYKLSFNVLTLIKLVTLMRGKFGTMVILHLWPM